MLAQFDAGKARTIRGALREAGAAGDWGMDLRDWNGVSVPITESNKEVLLRRLCIDILVAGAHRLSAWEHVRRGFYAAGGDAVVAAMKQVGLSSLHALVYDPEARVLRAAGRAQAAADDSYVRTHSRPCPSCSAPSDRFAGCMHITCRCGARWNWCCGRQEVRRDGGGWAHPPMICPNGGIVPPM